MNSRNVASKWQCTRCNKNYQYKGGLSAHIRRKHPVGAPINPKKKTEAPKPNDSNLPNPTIVNDLISMNTQDLEALLKEEQEYYDAAEEIEHNIGINDSMVDWFNVNFQSSFSNTGEFTSRTASVISPKSCEDCKVSAITFENQRKIILKQDSQIQESHKTQKASNDENKKLRSKTKSLEAQLEETTSLLETAMDESASEITALKAELKTKTDLLEAKSQNTLKSPKQNAQNTNEVEVSMEKCKSCGFSSKSKEVIKQHMMSRHGVKIRQQDVFRCLMCPEIFKDKQNFKKHKAEHQRELDVITFEHVCKECSLSFGSREDYLEHLLEKHRPKTYRPTEIWSQM